MKMMLRDSLRPLRNYDRTGLTVDLHGCSEGLVPKQP
jgi:hypothetical protein